MQNTGRVDKNLFQEDHYLGKPADDSDRIISRRIRILQQQPGFFEKKADLLEAGCGNGSTMCRIAPHFNSCVGADIFDYTEEFNFLKQKFNAYNCSFLCIDLEEEVISRQFDRFISFEVIEHLRNENSVRRYYDLLAPGGVGAISVPNKWWIFETHGARLPFLPWNRVPFFSWLPKQIHERFANARIYTKKRIRELLIRHGFEILDCRYITAPMDVLKDSRIKRLFIRYIFHSDTTTNPFLSTAIFVLVKKPLT